MDKRKAIIKKLLYPPLWLIVLLIPIAGLLLAFGLSGDCNNTVIAYVSYLVSAYALTVFVLRFPKMVHTVKNGFWNLPPVKRIVESRTGQLFMNDITFKGAVSIYQGFAVNTAYAVFRGLTAYLYRSIWFTAITVYYFMLGVIYLSLVYYVRRMKEYKAVSEKELFEWKGYRVCGYLMLLLNTGMTGMMVLMVRDNLHYTYPGYIIYLSALYTFYTAITATIHVFKFRKLKSPILSASKALAFTGATMSVMALQTAMIAQFGADNAVFRQIINTLTGAVVCVLSLMTAVYMIVKSTRTMKKIKMNKTET